MRALTVIAVGLLGASGAAQDRCTVSCSSGNYFIRALEFGDGEAAASPVYRIQPSMGGGALPEPQSKSATYVVQGGFASMLTLKGGGAVLTGADPFFVAPTGNTLVHLRGFDLLAGGSPSVSIGGVPAIVQLAASSLLKVEMPEQTEPGYQPVVLHSGAGPSGLAHGVGVLPMLFSREPLNVLTPVKVHYQGTHGDLLVVVLAFGRAPSPLVVADFRYGLILDVGTVLGSVVAPVTNADGSWVLNGPPLPITGTMLLQVLSLSQAPGYAPGSWTNDVVL